MGFDVIIGARKMNKHIERQMKERGYTPVEGAAILNDIAIAVTSNDILSPKLSTQQSVDCFNKEFSIGWQLFRKSAKVTE